MSELKATAIIKPSKSVEKYVVGKYIIVHTIEGESEIYDLKTSSTPENRFILREVVSNNEVISKHWRYCGYTYDFIDEKWYLDR